MKEHSHSQSRITEINDTVKNAKELKSLNKILRVRFIRNTTLLFLIFRILIVVSLILYNAHSSVAFPGRLQFLSTSLSAFSVQSAKSLLKNSCRRHYSSFGKKQEIHKFVTNSKIIRCSRSFSSMSFGQFASTTQFYLYGRWHCTRTGWENASKNYPKPNLLEDPNLSLAGKVYLVTGGNTGIGREIATFAARKGAVVYIVCRNPQRAFTAQEEIMKETQNHNVHVLIADCGIEADIRRVWEEFQHHQRTNYNFSLSSETGIRLDVLVCNAGALLNHRNLTSEGVEVTFATHLLFGTYLLGSLAIPTLETSTSDGRIVVVSSGGMYNTKFPTWEVATSTGLESYNGQLAYAYAKRGQVLLCEKWAELHPKLTVVSCHPGWTMTEGVESAYGSSKSFLEPLRTTWQGAEGIIWLTLAPKEQIQSGEFYLDRSPQRKHLAGAFFSAGSFTKNTKEEIDLMMKNLEEWANGRRPSELEVEENLIKKRPLEPLKRAIDLRSDFMGDWYVLGNIPTPLEVGIRNAIEQYEWDEKNQLIKVLFSYYGKGASSSSQMSMRAKVANDPISSHWKLDPKIFGIPIPVGLDYLILDLAEDNSYTIVGVPDRAYLWIMIRDVPSEFININIPITEAYKFDDKATFGESVQGEAVQEGKIDLSEQEKKIEKEKDILRKSLSTVTRLGFDVNKILRVPWITLK